MADILGSKITKYLLRNRKILHHNLEVGRFEELDFRVDLILADLRRLQFEMSFGSVKFEIPPQPEDPPPQPEKDDEILSQLKESSDHHRILKIHHHNLKWLIFLVPRS